MPDLLNVLIIGSGGREHAIAWKIAQSPRLGNLYTAPGNPGTAILGTNVPLNSSDQSALVQFAAERRIDLVVIGPEQPLSEGLTDAFQAAGVRVFGPTRAAAQLESSKVFAKQFMLRNRIPTARYKVASDYPTAVAMLQSIEYPVVIKVSGLAAGKGVIVPTCQQEAEAALRSILVDNQFGSAGNQVLLEEKLSGEEVSVLAFTDGQVVIPMLPAQDHKRLLDGDRGPNTGGMGAYAPAPVCDAATLEWITQRVLEPTIRGMRSEGAAYCGVLYAGMMLTEQGPRVLEFNCRFGDPETQAILPLLDSDLLDILLACSEGGLSPDKVKWKDQRAVCVVLASGGYPEKSLVGKPIYGLKEAAAVEKTAIFHAGTAQLGDQIVNSAGRVLGVTAWEDTLQGALDIAYYTAGKVRFEGMQFRSDIGLRATTTQTAPVVRANAYSRSGVSIDAGNRAVELMSQAVRSTYSPQVLGGLGAFGGLYDVSALKEMRHPVLVASTDGVGTKVKLASEIGSYRTIGMDIVNHCINDILVQGAKPLFFLDYYATSRLIPEHVAQIVTGMADACRESRTVLLGGETAEMPGVYAGGEFDVAGTIVGIVDKEKILPRPDLQAGDVIIGLPSSGPHTNGYSLIRTIVAEEDKSRYRPELGCSLYEALLRPHRSYLPTLAPLLEQEPSAVKALVHITGGGFLENIPRVLLPDLNAVIDTHAWPVPPLFQLLQRLGQIGQEEMYRVFNMGVGMLIVTAPENADLLLDSLEKPAWVIGRLETGCRKVELR